MFFEKTTVATGYYTEDGWGVPRFETTPRIDLASCLPDLPNGKDIRGVRGRFEVIVRFTPEAKR
jgi:hypothetical protein